MIRFINARSLTWSFCMLLTSGLVSGCAGNSVGFDFLENTRQLKPGTIAVIGGKRAAIDDRLADLVARKLRERTMLTVLDQPEIQRRLSPSSIVAITPATLQPWSDDADAPGWLSPRDKKRIDAIQAKIRADYVLVIWETYLARVDHVGGSFVLVNYTYQIGVNARLLEYPQGKVVGYSSFGYAKGGGYGGLTSRAEEEDMKHVEALLDGTATYLADHFIETAVPAKSRRRRS